MAQRRRGGCPPPKIDLTKEFDLTHMADLIVEEGLTVARITTAAAQEKWPSYKVLAALFKGYQVRYKGSAPDAAVHIPDEGVNDSFGVDCYELHHTHETAENGKKPLRIDVFHNDRLSGMRIVAHNKKGKLSYIYILQAYGTDALRTNSVFSDLPLKGGKYFLSAPACADKIKDFLAKAGSSFLSRVQRNRKEVQKNGNGEPPPALRVKKPRKPGGPKLG